MDYFGTLKKAFHLTFKNKFLWIFGLFAGAGTSYAGLKFGMLPSFGSTSDTKIPKDQEAIILNTITSFVDKNIMWILFGLLIFLLLTILMFVLNIISQGALINAANKIDKKEKTDFWRAFHQGAKEFWRIWGMIIIYLLMIFGAVCLVFIPVATMVSIGNIALAIAWGMLMMAIFAIFIFLLGLVSPYSLRVIVLERLSVWESIRESLHFVRKNFVSVIIMFLLIMAAGFVYGAVLAIGMVLLGSILFAIGCVIWLVSSAVGVIYAILASVAFFAVLMVFGSFFNAFNSVVLTLTYDQLKRRA